MTYFGSGWQNSAIEIPDPDGDFYAAKEVPHGRVSQQRILKGDGQVAAVLRLHSAGLRHPLAARYPVLYLLHGWGEDETGGIGRGTSI